VVVEAKNNNIRVYTNSGLAVLQAGSYYFSINSKTGKAGVNVTGGIPAYFS